MDDKLEQLLYDMLEEEIPTIDITTDNLHMNQNVEAIITSTSNGVLSGVGIISKLFSILDDEIYIKIINYDGTYIEEGNIIAIIKGDLSALIKGKNIALNILERMSSIASKTRKSIEVLSHSSIELISNMNTTPSLRLLENLAIMHGGAKPLLESLSDSVYIHNHHTATGLSKKAISEILYERIDHKQDIIVEVSTFVEFIELIHSKCDIIIFRDMKEEEIEKCISHNTFKKLGVFIRSVNNVSKYQSLHIDFIVCDDLTQVNRTMTFELNLNI